MVSYLDLRLTPADRALLCTISPCYDTYLDLDSKEAQGYCSMNNRISRKSQQKGKLPSIKITIRTYCHVKHCLTKLQIFIHNAASVFTDLLISNFT